MRSIETGDIAPEILTNSVNGDVVRISGTKPTLLSFFRFASCPFCNLRLRALEAWKKEHPDIALIGVFGSPEEDVKKAISIHNLSFPLVSDTDGILYKKYGIRKSLFGMLYGMFYRMPTLLKAVFVDHYIPKATNGHLLTMPAEFLIGADARILIAHYGRDEGDHLSLEKIEEVL